jgi:hypothetical protein
MDFNEEALVVRLFSFFQQRHQKNAHFLILLEFVVAVNTQTHHQMKQNYQRPEKDNKGKHWKKEETQTENRETIQFEGIKSFVFRFLPNRSTQERFGRVSHHFPKAVLNGQPEFGLKEEDEESQKRELKTRRR